MLKRAARGPETRGRAKLQRKPVAILGLPREIWEMIIAMIGPNYWPVLYASAMAFSKTGLVEYGTWKPGDCVLEYMRSGHFRLAAYAGRHWKWTIGPMCFDAAVKNRHYIPFPDSSKVDRPDELAKYRLANGDYHLLEDLLQTETYLLPDLARYCMSYGLIDQIDWILSDKDRRDRIAFDGTLASIAYISGWPSVVAWLSACLLKEGQENFDRHLECTPYHQAVTAANGNDSGYLLHVLMHQGTGDVSGHVCEYAAMKGNLALIEAICALFPNAKPSEEHYKEMASIALACGHLEILKYLDKKCPEFDTILEGPLAVKGVACLDFMASKLGAGFDAKVPISFRTIEEVDWWMRNKPDRASGLPYRKIVSMARLIKPPVVYERLDAMFYYLFVMLPQHGRSCVGAIRAPILKYPRESITLLHKYNAPPGFARAMYLDEYDGLRTKLITCTSRAQAYLECFDLLPHERALLQLHIDDLRRVSRMRPHRVRTQSTEGQALIEYFEGVKN